MTRLRLLLALVALTAWMGTLGCNAKNETSTTSTTATGTASQSPMADDHQGHDHPHAGSGSAESTAYVPQQVPQQEAQQALDSAAAPEVVVRAFLEATRFGDDGLAAQLLSKKAVEETARVGLTVKPPGTPSMQYQIGDVEYPKDAPNGAYVHSIWTESYEDGEDRFDVTWVLRRQTEGWRIVGMAAQLDENEPPYFLNFEQPDDLYQKIQDAAGPQDAAVDAAGAAANADGAAADATTAAQPNTNFAR